MSNHQGRVVSFEPGPKARELLALRDENVARGISYVLPTFIKEARGAMVTDVDGNEFLDFASGIGVVNFGHNHPAVVEAIKNQAVFEIFFLNFIKTKIAAIKPIKETQSPAE